jgi:hypothetical protein
VNQRNFPLAGLATVFASMTEFFQAQSEQAPAPRRLGQKLPGLIPAPIRAQTCLNCQRPRQKLAVNACFPAFDLRT